MNLVEISVDSLNEKLDEAYHAAKSFKPHSNIRGGSYFECALKTYHSVVGTPPPVIIGEPGWELSAEVGKAIHNVIQKQLVKAGIVLVLPAKSIEVVVNSAKYKYAGVIDGIIKNAQGDVSLLEIKNIDDKYFNPKDDNYTRYYLDKLAHYEMQLQAYMHLWRHPETNYQATQGRILVINLNYPKQRRLYKASYDPVLMGSEFERIAGLKVAIESKTPPAPEPSRGPCTFCNWQKICPTTEKERRNGGFKHV